MQLQESRNKDFMSSMSLVIVITSTFKYNNEGAQGSSKQPILLKIGHVWATNKQNEKDLQAHLQAL